MGRIAHAGRGVGRFGAGMDGVGPRVSQRTQWRIRLEARRYLESVGAEVKGLFVQNRMISSYEEWAEEFLRDPLRQARSSAQYLRDAIDWFGTRTVSTPRGLMRRFRIFDVERDGGVGAVHGQEEAQNDVYRILGNFVRAGRVNKLILLHGPNGSAKSTLVAALARGLEIYSRADEGALHRINWIFPTESLVRGSIGFGGGRGPDGELGSYAHLAPDQVDASIACEMKDHPIFLIPRGKRRELLEEAVRARGEASFVLPASILDGELCHKCRQIYAGLMGSYGGDYLEVLRHVQVERFYVSKRYLVGAVTIEPQLAADASYSQLTYDRSAGRLPAALQNIDLFSPHGPLVYANRGLVEFSDLLKRPVDALKYLLGPAETGVVGMEHFLLHLDEVMIATSNEKQLSTFKESADFPSYKGRIELVQVPYLRQARVEQKIYESKLSAAALGGKHIAPHALELASKWAVLTRLRKPDPEQYDFADRPLVEGLTPLEKLELYDGGDPPSRLGEEGARRLLELVPALYEESEATPTYEGLAGASAREVHTALLNAGQNPAHHCLSPQAVLEELRQLCKEKSVYEFLQLASVGGYQDAERFVDLLEEELRRVVEGELAEAAQDAGSEDPQQVTAALERRFGYCADCAGDVVARYGTGA